MTQSSHASGEKLDFTTFGINCFPLTITSIPPEFLSQFRNQTPKDRRFDAIVFDIEHLSDIVKRGIEGPDGERLMPLNLQAVIPQKALTRLLEFPPDQKRLLGIDGNSIPTFPLRFGRNGVALKLDAPAKRLLSTMGESTRDAGAFNLDWLTSKNGVDSLSTNGLGIHVMLPNWYLPAVSFLSAFYTEKNPNHLTPEECNKVFDRLKCMQPLLHPSLPFFDDLSQAREIYNNAEGNLIVLGVGPWFSAQRATQDGYYRETLPVRCSEKDSFWQLWCECVSFFSNRQDMDGCDLDDAKQILRAMIETDLDSAGALGDGVLAFKVDDVRDRPRTLPPLNGGRHVARAEIAERWEAWVDEVRQV
jgi:hypothetical protein